MKKKQHERDVLRYLFKTMRIMRLSLFLIVISSAMAFSANSYSQNTKLTLELNNITVKEALKTIEKQSEFLFFYQEKHVDLDRLVSIHVTNHDVESVLNKLFAGTDNIYVINDRQIVIGIAPRKELVRQIQSISGSVKSITEQPQRKEISGKVTDKVGLPLPGVSIIVKGTTIGTVTNSEGEFSLSIPLNAEILQFSFVGMSTQEIAIEGRVIFNMVMEEDIIGIEEVVAVGYGTMKKRELTGAVVSVKGEEIIKYATSDFASAIQGQMAGVSIRNINPAPGENAQITIRGLTSLQSGGSEPLFIVDGIPYTSNPNISPNEIESIEVLKDGASAAIYGSRASAGVILITTKKGKEGQMDVVFDSYYGVQKITSDIPLVGTTGDLYINEIMYRYQTGKFDPLSINLDALQYNTDWMKELQVDLAPIQNHSVNVSGGRRGLSYSVIGTYFNQVGSLINSEYEKYSLRSNTGFKKGKFSIQANLNVSLSDQIKEPSALMYDAINLRSYRRPLNSKSDEFSVGGSNAEVITAFVGKLKQENNSKENTFNGNMQLRYEIVNGLLFNLNIGGSFYNNHGRVFNPSYSVYNDEGVYNPVISNENANLRLNNSNSEKTIGEFVLNYDKTFNKHSVKLLVGNTYESSNSISFSTGANYISSNKTPVLSNGEPTKGTHSINKTNLVSLIGRISYDYKSKYLVSAIMRRDGSSKFGHNNRYGIFPSVSAGYLISEENFFKEIKDLISLAKIRISYGTTGSDKIPTYSYSPAIISNVDYLFGLEEYLAKGMTQPGFADPNIKWESNISKNLGLDLIFLKGKAGLEFDIYEQNKKDMLLSIVTPISAGSTPLSSYNYFLTNIGDLNNKGLEISGRYNHQIREIRFKFSGTFTKNKNEVISLSREGEIIYGGYPNIVRVSQTEPVAAIKEGLPVGSFLVYETNGTIKTDEELIEYQKLNPTAQKGDLRYVDSNKDGEITIDDRVYKGTYHPDFEYGINFDVAYRNFDLTVQLYGVQGNTIYNGPKQYAYAQKRHRDLIYAWTDQNPTSNIPTPRINTDHPNVQTSTDLFLENGSYLRIRNISLGYSFSMGIIQKMGINKLRLYVSAQNPVTWTKYSGYDPEVGSRNPLDGGLDRGNYPVTAVFRTGISINF